MVARYGQTSRLASYTSTGYTVRMNNNRGSAALREWMEAHGKTQAQVGVLVGVHQTKVSDWLLGRRISLSDAIGVSKALGIAVELWVQPVVLTRKLAKSA